MTNLTNLHKRFVQAAWALGGIASLSLLYLLFPFAASTAEAKVELDRTTLRRIEKEKQTAPLRGLPEKLAKSQTDAQAFYKERLTSRTSVVLTELGKMAKDSGITLTTAKYTSTPSEIAGLELVQIETQMSGFYPQLAKFIHEVEQSKQFYLIDALSLADLKGGTVKLDMTIETYLRQPMKGDTIPKSESSDTVAPKKVPAPVTRSQDKSKGSKR